MKISNAKKFLACFMAMLTILTSLSVCMVYAADESDFTYKKETNWDTETIEITITGYNGSDAVVTIPETIEDSPVTSIGNSAFKGNKTITSVTIPATVTEIREYAFEDCTNLAELKLPANLKYFGDRAIKNTAIYNDSKNWDGNSLYFNNILVEVSKDLEGEYKIKDGTVIIGGDAFMSNRNITSVIFPSSLKYVNGGAFQFCRSIEKITLNEGLEVIGGNAFSYTSITELNLPNSLKVVENMVFSGTSLSKLHFPANVEEISDTAFSGLNLEEVSVDSNNKTFFTADGVLFEKTESGNILLCYPSLKKGESYSIPEGTYDTGFSAFMYCKNLKELNIPASMKYFYVYQAQSIEKFNVNEANERYYSVDGAVYRKSDNELVAYPSAKKDEKFATAEGTTSVGFSVFQSNHYLKEVTFTEGIVSIESAFSNCANLETINLPSTLETLSSSIIDNCTNFKAINFNGTMEEFKVFTFYFYGESETGIYAYCTDGTIELLAPKGTTPSEPEEITTAPTTATEPEEVTTAPATTAPTTATEPEENTTTSTDATEPEENTTTSTKPQESTTAPAGDKEFETGDANMDNKLNIRDATLIQKHLAKITTMSEAALELADFNKDSKVNVKDATSIQKFIAGIR